MAEFIETVSDSSDSVGGVRGNVEVKLKCGPCSEDGDDFPAEGYCVDCAEHLCETCFTHHKRPRQTRHHRLQDKNEMPKSIGLPIDARPTKREKCSLHKNSDVISYCKTHDQICCRSCVLTGHSNCVDVKNIDEIAVEYENSDEFRKFNKTLDAMQQQCEVNTKHISSNMETINTCHDAALKDFVKLIDEIKAKDTAKMNSMKETNESIVRDVQMWKAAIEKHREGNQPSDVFILIKSSQKQLEMMENNMELVSRSNGVNEYRFVSETNGEGRLTIEQRKALQMYRNVDSSQTPTLIKTLETKAHSDKNTCYIRDMVLLNSDKLLVTDGPNRSIKVIDIASNSISSYVNVRHYPWELAAADNGSVYVSLQGGKANTLLHFPCPLVTMNNSDTIVLPWKCRAVKCHKQTLLVQCSNPNKLQQTDTNGKQNKTIHDDIAVVKDDNITHSLFSPVTKSLLLTFENHSQITEITLEGKVTEKFKSEKLKRPSGLAMDIDGSVLVCCAESRCIVRISRNGEICEYITDMTMVPFSLAIDGGNRILYVGGENSNIIQVYKL